MVEQEPVKHEGTRPRAVARQQILDAIDDAITGLDYGSVVLTVHGARVVQLEVTRKQRFEG